MHLKRLRLKLKLNNFIVLKYNIFYSVLFLCFINISFAQAEKNKQYEEEVFTVVENMPIYDGCNETNNYDNVKCTEQAIQQYIFKQVFPIAPEIIKADLGKFHLEFIVDVDGSVRSFSPLNSDSILNEKIVNKLMEMPKFTPGKQRNIPVKVKYKIPFYVRIE